MRKYKLVKILIANINFEDFFKDSRIFLFTKIFHYMVFTTRPLKAKAVAVLKMVAQ